MTYQNIATLSIISLLGIQPHYTWANNQNDSPVQSSLSPSQTQVKLTSHPKPTVAFEPPCHDASHLEVIPILLAEDAENAFRRIRPKKPSHEDFVKSVNLIRPGPAEKYVVNQKTGKGKYIRFNDYYSFKVDALNELESRSRLDHQPRKWAPLSTNEVLTIRLYAGSDYQKINLNLDKPEFLAFKDMAAIALSKLPKYSGVVLRGENLGQNGLALMQAGNKVVYTGFLSTSPTNPFGGNVNLTIHSETGRNISEFADLLHENEVLFAPGTTLEILERREPAYESGPISIIAREIQSPEEPPLPVPWD